MAYATAQSVFILHCLYQDCLHALQMVGEMRFLDTIQEEANATTNHHGPA